MERRRGLFRWTLAALAVALAVPLALTGCSGSAASQIDYVVDGPLITYNTNTVVGAASAGAQAFARTLTGFGYHGPDGQVVADRDFGTVSVVGRAPLVLDYQIADNAVYSDGKPVTCDDLVLAWAAQSGRFPGFDAATQAGYVDIANVDCTPGQKKARVSFIPDRGVVDYTQLFTATSMMPSHVVADLLSVDVTAALLANNAPVVDGSPSLEHHLGPETRLRPERFPVVGSVQDGIGAGRRRRGAGRQRPLVGPQADHQADHGVAAGGRYPGAGQEPHRRRRGRGGRVVGALTSPDNYQRSDTPSAGIEQLIFSRQGALARLARRALALCTPRDAIAQRRRRADRELAAQSGHRGRLRPGRRRQQRGPIAKADPARPATRWTARR